MTDSNPSNEGGTGPRTHSRGGRRWLLVALPGALLAGLLGARAYAFGPGGGPSPEQMERMFDRRVDRVLDRIDATADQRTRIKATLARLKPEIKALHEEKQKLQDAGKKALQADPVDGNEVERVRREAIKLADRGSVAMSRALVEVAGVLTPAQRQELAQEIGSHHGRGRWR